MITMKNITKSYRLAEADVPILKGINLHIDSGEYVSIMGASGSGKSTLMNIIGCLDRPSDGAYYLEDQNLTALDKNELAYIRNQLIGFVFQQFNLLPKATALENVMLPMAYANIRPKEQKERAAAALERVAMGHRLNNRPNQMSGGQQQRVAIARAIVNNPVMLLADEPTGALDSHTTQEVMELFGELNASGITVVMVTHEADVARNSHRIIWFRDGQIIHDRLSPSDLNHVI